MGQVTRHTDPAAFLAEVSSWLEESEARNNLVLGILGTLVSHPAVYDTFHLWSVRERGSLAGVALVTPPYRPVLADAASPGAVADLAAAIGEDLTAIGGILGNHPTVDWFLDEWHARTGAEPALVTGQGVFVLDTVEDVPRPEGHARPAADVDADVLARWVADFHAEALPDHSSDADWSRRFVALRLSGDPAFGARVWEVDGRLVSMSTHGSPTRNGIRISAVYTPPELRGRGYATALVADHSRAMLDAGYRLCMLNTDLANPTSNEIYRRIGYRKVAESADYRFG